MSERNYTTKAGTITTRPGKRGLEFSSYNIQRQRMIHIGTLISKVYEKSATILRKENALTLTTAEVTTIQDNGGGFVRFVVGRSATYSISVPDFLSHSKPYYNPGYGQQLACELKYLQFSNTYQKRNSQTDNPTVPAGNLLEHVQARQLGLFGGVE